MKIITLAQIKANSRISSTDEDTLLSQLGETAEQMALNMMERTYDSILEEYGEYPAPIQQACLALVDHLYQYRGIVSGTNLYTVPYTIDAMLKPYITF